MYVIKSPVLKYRRTAVFFLFLLQIFFVFADNTSVFKKLYKDDGMEIYSNINEYKGEKVKVCYKFYNSFYKTYSGGVIKKNTPLYIPYGTEICIWLKTGNGKIPYLKNFTAKQLTEDNLIEVVSPRKGSWSETQKLVIDADDSVQIMYTADGSNPAEVGLLYTEPVLIEKNGAVDLRITAIAENGLRVEKKISYFVSDDTKKTKPDKNIINSSVRENNIKPSPVQILNWYFVHFDFDSPVKYLLAKKNTEDEFNSGLLKIYTEPVLVDREEDVILFWSSADYNDGLINKLFLPKKPALIGIPPKVTNEDVEFYFDNNDFSYSMEDCIDKFFDDSECSFKREDNKYYFNVKPNVEKKVNMRIYASYDELVHGAFDIAFTVDKIPPDKPIVNFSHNFSPVNTDVEITLKSKTKSDAKVIAEITPDLYVKDDNKIILTGSETESVAYSIVIYSEDAAGNKSLPIKKDITVDKNAIYVDYNRQPSSFNVKTEDGNPSNPFSSIPEAVDYINNKSRKIKRTNNSSYWKIYLHGDCILNEAILINHNLKIIANNKKSLIRFSKNAGFVISNSSFELNNCEVSRREQPDEPRAVPLIYAAYSTVNLKNVTLHAVEGGTVLTSLYSHLNIFDSAVISKQTNYCLMFNLDNSSAVLSGVEFDGSGFSVVAISCVNSNIEAENVKGRLTPGFTARFIEAWNSTVGLAGFECIRLPETALNKDTAIWYNRKSKLDIQTKPLARGFFNQIKREE